MKALALFTAVAAGAILLLGAILTLVFRSPADRRALLVSGVVALLVQVVTFAVARFGDRSKVTQRWAIGVVLRFGTLVVYALLALKPLGLPATAALISLATYFFVTTLIEPRLLSV